MSSIDRLAGRATTTGQAMSFVPRVLLATALALFCSSLPAGSAPGVSVGTSAIAPAGSGSVPAYLLNNSGGVALQFDVLYDASRISAVNVIPDAASKGYLVSSGQPAAGVVRVVVYSLSNALLTEGAVIDLQLSVLPSAPEGPSVLQITNATVSDVSGATVQPLTLHSGLLVISAGAGSRVTLLARAVNGQVQLMLTGPANKNYILQSSADLSQWISFSTNVLTDGQIIVTNLAPANSSTRFYRANYAP